MMEAVEITMSLFRAMDDDEKRATILALGEEVEETGLIDKLFGKSKAADGPAPPAKAATKVAPKRGVSPVKKKPYWIRTATGFDASQKGVMKIEGEWLSEPNLIEGSTGGEYAVVGFRWPEKSYHLLRAKPGFLAPLKGGPDGELGVKNAEHILEGSFKEVMESLQEHLG
jgi:hypothetical protein